MADINPSEGINTERHPQLLDASKASLVVIDVQKVLVPFIWEKEKMLRNIGYVVEIANIHELPTIVTEHNPKGLGETDDDLVELLKSTVGYNPLYKNIFSCCGHEDFLDTVKATGRKQIIVVGMETHICVNQTVLDLINHGYQVHVVEDAVRCRWKNSHKIGIKKMRNAGAVICDWEMAAYELTWGAKTPKFKELLNLMKRVSNENDKSHD